MSGLSDDAISWFCRHLVLLECQYMVRHTARPEEEARKYYTGFLLYVNGYTLWVTAGHCIEEIDNDIIGRPDRYRNVRFRFVDFLHHEVSSTEPVPFDLVAMRYKPYLVHRDAGGVERGWDFGGLLLRPHYVMNLRANNVVPVGETNWINVPDEFDFHFMLGVADENVTQDEGGNWLVAPSMIPVAKLDGKPARYAEHTDPMFYGTVGYETVVGSIRGMSGGPILGMKRMPDGSLRYWIIAVQSGWYPADRLSCATPLRELYLLVSRAIDEARTDV